MSRSILEVKGIGPATAVLLTENGITTAEELAAKSPLQVAAIKGFSEIRATQVIANARALLTDDSPAPLAKPENEKKAKKKQKGKKKDKKADREGKKVKKSQKKKKK